MAQIRDGDDLFDLLLGASKRAMAKTYYEAAYHALTATLHCAQSMKDANCLEEVAAEARHQLAHINTTAKANVMSSFAAARRPSGVDMYDILAKTASVRAKMFKRTDHRNESTF